MLGLTLWALLLQPSEAAVAPKLTDVVKTLVPSDGYNRGVTLAGGSHDTYFPSWLPGVAFDIDSQFDKAGELRAKEITIRMRKKTETPVVIPGTKRKESRVEKLERSAMLVYMAWRLIIDSAQPKRE